MVYICKNCRLERKTSAQLSSRQLTGFYNHTFRRFIDQCLCSSCGMAGTHGISVLKRSPMDCWAKVSRQVLYADIWGENKRRVVKNGLSIYRIGKQKGLLNKILTYPIFFSPYWIYKATLEMKKNRPDIIVVRDLPISLLAILISRILKIPVIIDMAENYPAALISYQNPKYKFFLFGNALLPRLYEKIVVNLINHIIVVAKSQENRLAKMGVRREKITIATNTPDNIEASSTAPRYFEIKTFEPTLLYVGKVDIHRGIETLIRAIAQLRKRYENIGAVIVGDGKDVDRLKGLTKALGLENSIQFTGWVKQQLPGINYSPE